ncbi:InlB B-repeat-containing protein [Streptococcus equi]|uniref:InlB B-repeat-containing protein n=1 Tax=Streptococcus equi TaxID=1336 RepID=UPI0026592D54|nr:InlB B-repeat-containing protein [Streptococcus equi]WKF65732.1 InlB B-repeat-containing protein [Streptococcus equi subsp. zooepidemicus]
MRRKRKLHNILSLFLVSLLVFGTVAPAVKVFAEPIDTLTAEPAEQAKLETNDNTDEVNTQKNETMVSSSEPSTEPHVEISHEDKGNTVEANISDEEAFYGMQRTANGVTVTINATKGVFPKGTTVKVTDVAKEDVKAIISNKAKHVKDVAAVDITFYHNGQEIEPKGKVEVKLATQKEVAGEEHRVVHIKDNKEVEEISTSSSTNASFKADSFSIYVIVGTDKPNEQPETGRPIEKPTRRYEFYSQGKVVNTQILKNGEKLLEPSIPSLMDNVFVNWSNKDGSEFNGFGTINDISKKETVALYANYTKKLAIRFHNTVEKNIIVKVGEEGKKVKTDDVFFEVSVGNYINGWSKTPDGTEPVGKEITVGDQDIDLYPLITGGHWLFFNGNENGGNLITKPLEPQFVKEGAKPSKVIPERKGYDFAGWYEDKDCTKALDFNKTLSENKEIFAKWTPKASSYTIRIWQQRCVNGQFVPDHYVLNHVKTVDGISDSSIIKADAEKLATNYVEELAKKGDRRNWYDYYHYDFNAAKTTIEHDKVRGDGSSIVNVYYDLHPYTFKYYLNSKNDKLDINNYDLQLTVNGEPYSKDDFYIVNNVHLGEVIDDRRPDIIVKRKDEKVEERVRIGWKADHGSDHHYYLFKSDWENKAHGVPPQLLVRETEPGFEMLNFYPLFSTGKMIKVVRFDYFETLEKGIYEERREEEESSITTAFSFGNQTGFTRVPSDQSYSDKIKVKRPDGRIEEVTIPDKKEQVDRQTFHNIYNRNSYELTFFNKDVVEKSYKGDQAILYGTNIHDKLYTPKKPSDLSELYTFKGWANKKGDVYDLTKYKKMPAGNLVLYAKWGIKQVTVTFDSNGGTPVAPQTINAGEAVPMPKAPTRDNFKFAGWVLPNGSPFNVNTRLTEDTRLIARWLDKSAITVEYDPGAGAKAPVDSNRYMDISNARVLEAPKTLPKDKFFRGWELDGVVYYPGQFMLLNSQLAKKQPNGTYKVTLRAVYSDAAEKTKLIYHSNFGDHKIIEEDYINNSDVKILGIKDLHFEREGYDFIGWNTKADGTGLSYKVGDDIRVDNDLPLPNELFAQWKKKASSSEGNHKPNSTKPNRPIVPPTTNETKRPHVSTATKPMKHQNTILPKTGDETNLFFYAGLMFLSASLCLLLDMRYRKAAK